MGQYEKKKNKKDKTERAMEIGSRTREQIVKWNQMTAPRFQTASGGGWGLSLIHI